MPELRIDLMILALLAAMFVAFGIGLTRRVGAVQLALLAVVWCSVDERFEGEHLITMSKTHSIVSADVPGLVAFACAVWLWWRLRRRG